MAETIFSKIIAGEIPGHFVYEDDVCVAILDAFPSVSGQTLVIPRQAEAYLFNLDDEIYQHLFAVAKRVALALDTTFDTSRTCLVVEGFEVPHVHIKLYPMPKEATELTSYLTHTSKADQDTLMVMAEKIKGVLSSGNCFNTRQCPML